MRFRHQNIQVHSAYSWNPWQVDLMWKWLEGKVPKHTEGGCPELCGIRPQEGPPTHFWLWGTTLPSQFCGPASRLCIVCPWHICLYVFDLIAPMFYIFCPYVWPHLPLCFDTFASKSRNICPFIYILIL